MKTRTSPRSAILPRVLKREFICKLELSVVVGANGLLKLTPAGHPYF